ncbi:hypothetical protein ACFLZ2_01380 [Candidatus Margulisiibacteriota bacterium]
MSHHNKKTSRKHIIKLFLLYWSVLVICILWIDYYAYEALNPLPFILIALIVSAVATFFHVRQGQRSGVDEIADKL